MINLIEGLRGMFWDVLERGWWEENEGGRGMGREEDGMGGTWGGEDDGVGVVGNDKKILG